MRDITGQKQADERQQRLAKIVQNSSDFIGICDLDWRVSYVNEAGRRLVGLVEAEEVGDTHVLDYLAPEDRAFVGNEVFPVVIEEGRWTGELNLSHFGTGEPFPVTMDIFRIDDPGTGEPVSITTIARDITERKRAEEELRDSEERFRATFEQAAAGMAHTAPDGRLLRVNQKLCDILGYTREEMLGMTVQEGTHPDDLDKDLEQARQLLAGEIETNSMEKRLLRKDDSIVWIDLTISLVRKPSGEPDYFIAVCEDIDERKRTEKQIAYHSHLLANMHDAVIATDERFLVTAWNEAAEVMYGWRADEVMGRHVREVVPSEPSDEQWAEVRRELDETGRFRTEWVTRHRDGSPVHVEVTAVALRDDRGEVSGYLSIDRDVSDRKRRDEEHARHAAVLEATNDFVATAATGGRILSVNRAGRRMLGIGEDEDITDTTIADYHPEWAYRIVSGGLPAASREGAWSGEAALLCRDGREVPVSQSIVSHKGPDGEEEYFTTVARDITEQKRFEEEQQRLVNIVQNSSDFIGIADLEWRAVFLNEAGQRMVGLHGIEEVRQTEVADYFMPEDREFLQGVLAEKVMEEGRWAGELRLRHFETGEAIPVLWDGFRVDDPRTGEPIGLATVTRDITERKRAEEELRDSEEHLRFVLDAGGLGAWRIDVDPPRLETSDTCKRNFGLSPEDDFPIEKFLSMIHPDDLDNIRSEVERAISTQTDYEPDDYRIITPGGETRWIATRGRIVYAPDGEPSHLAGITLDITRRKRAEEEIDARARQQAAVAELGLKALANDGLQKVMDEAVACGARILEVEYAKIVDPLRDNGAGGEELFLRAGVGWREGLVGSIEEADLDPQSIHTLRSGEPVDVEDLPTEARFAPAPILSEHGVVSTVTVVIPGRERPFGVLGAYTENHRIFSEDDVNFLQAIANVLAARIEREEAEERLEVVRETERSRMARDLHDEALRDLTYAVAEAQHVQSTLKELTPVHRLGRLVAALKRTGQQLRGAIYDLRLGKEQDRPFPELLESLVERHREMAPQCDIRLHTGDGTLQGSLGNTGTELLRILGEALTNARRHSGARNVSVAVWASEEKLFAEASDDGRGFDPEQAMPAGRETTGGMGIRGMRERAHALGGDLQIESEPGQGTKVSFELVLEKHRGALGHEEPEEAPPGEQVRVLLVEDHAAVREAIASSFEREAGFEVVGQAASLDEARHMIESEPVEVAVIDLGLPDGYGGELIGELREANPEAQSLVLSANLDRAEVARAVESGAAGVLHKTVHLDEVAHAVRRLKAGETLMPMQEVVELLRFAGSHREQEYKADQTVARLTPREIEVLQALAEGLDGKGVAEKLTISLRTERNHIASILAKLGVHSQLQALVFALRHGVVEIR